MNIKPIKTFIIIEKWETHRLSMFKFVIISMKWFLSCISNLFTLTICCAHNIQCTSICIQHQGYPMSIHQLKMDFFQIFFCQSHSTINSVTSTFFQFSWVEIVYLRTLWAKDNPFVHNYWMNKPSEISLLISNNENNILNYSPH